MGLNKSISINPLTRYSLFIIFVLSAFLLAGCGESEEIVSEETAEGAAVMNYAGSESDPTSPAAVKIAQYEKMLEELRTENTSLKQSIVKLEQENRNITARLTELNAKSSFDKSSAEAGMQQAETAVVQDENFPPSQSTYDYAMDQFRARQYASAAKGFKAIVDGGGEDELVGRAKYWLGEAYFAQKDYNGALAMFLDVLKMKGSEKKADAQYMAARSYENLGERAEAKAAYEKVVKNYPMSKNVKSAKARWAKL
ncbi:MAG: tetratricopeptide repeat protein [Bacteroidetes bacterium]|nr:tetratricopeptide repeat protein [Bacteroidota bacterium]